jgi:hypothetical protein
MRRLACSACSAPPRALLLAADEGAGAGAVVAIGVAIGVPHQQPQPQRKSSCDSSRAPMRSTGR